MRKGPRAASGERSETSREWLTSKKARRVRVYEEFEGFCVLGYNKYVCEPQ